jgi:cysteine desulfurase
MIYLDNNATTPISPEVAAAMEPFLKAEFGNPSSAYGFGRGNRRVVDDARASVAELIGAEMANEIVFTSCGTESDNWAILGALRARPAKRHIITTRVEHEAVRKLAEQLAASGFDVSWIEVDEDGLFDPDILIKMLRPETAVVSIMHANNETGILFPVAEIAEIVKANSDALFHVDGVNAVGKIPINLKETAIDLYSLSAHKFHGPKGIGALYIRNGTDLSPMLIGGGQENGLRPGTEAVHQIAGIGAAANFVKDLSAMNAVRELRDRLEQGILSSIPEAYLNGTDDGSKRLPNTSNISFANTNGEAILALLEENGILVSTGSACNSDTHSASPVLQAMNIPYSKAMGSIRFSLGRMNNKAEIDLVIDRVREVVEGLRQVTAGL